MVLVVLLILEDVTMGNTFTITRKIEIDAGHRVQTHGSKCRNIHGHRYTVEAVCKGFLYLEGEQTDMVVDFGFLKTCMMDIIDVGCDHGFILSIQDQQLCPVFIHDFGRHVSAIQKACDEKGYWNSQESDVETLQGTKIYVVQGIPTAEVLAQHWYQRLKEEVQKKFGKDILHQVRVYETPNSCAVYPGHV